MMRLYRPFLLVLLALLPALPAAAQAPACPLPAEMQEDVPAMSATAQAMRAGVLRILVVGSASVLGAGTSGPEAAWPQRLRQLLQARLPSLTLELEARGGQGLTAADSLAIATAELARQPAALVVWQTGTVEAVRGLPVDEMVDVLNRGLDQLRGRHVDALLVDQQFSRFLRANADVEAYRDAMRVVAAAHGVPLLRRYELMRLWAEQHRLDPERASRAERVRAVDKLHDCVAQALLRLILAGVSLH